MTFTAAAKPDAAVEDFFATWKAPHPRPIAIPGKIIVEFGPAGNRGAIFCPEGPSNNAMVVYDGYERSDRNRSRGYDEGHLPCGTQVIYTGPDGTNIKYQGRTLTVLPRHKVELYVPEEEE